jgi:hypothetical protein
VTLYDPERVIVQAASIERDAKVIEALVLDVLDIVHAGESMVIGPPESAIGWTFYPISLSKSAIRRLASLPGNELARVKGDSIDQKFVNWLNRQAKKKKMDERIHFALASDLRSSRYGLF